MNKSKLEISVVICTYNRALYLPAALDSLYNQQINKDSYEVIVVNNNSSDNTESVCNHFIATHTDAHFIYLNEPNQGASFARNTGAAIAQSPLLCFMDDDAIAHANYLSLIIDFFKTHEDAGGLGGRIIPKYIPAEPVWMSHFVSSLVGNFDYSKEITVFSPNKYPLESNMIIKRVDFNLVNGFNTALPGVKGTLRIGGEGKEFFLKLKALGKTIYYHPAIIVDHVVETQKLTPEYLYRVASGIGRGEKVRTQSISTKAYWSKVIEYLFKLGASIVLAVGYLLQGYPSKMKPVIQFRIDALKGLLGY
jgi:glycosyltransferase involved in cell wall biosynthesis